MCKKLISKIKIRHKAKKIRDTYNEIAIECAKRARGFEGPYGNSTMANMWWDQYRKAYSGIDDTNKLLNTCKIF